MSCKNNIFNKFVVKKPWGEEHVIYSDGNKIAVTFLKILPGKETSLHCHSKKKTGFIILKGIAKVQIGIYKKNSFIYKSVSRLVFREGLFHKISNDSKKNLYALEFETPYIKSDLIRMDDKYGRSNKKYEGRSFFKLINKNYLIFKKPIKKYNKYKLQGKTLFINKVNSLKDIKIKKKNSSIAILEGKIVDKNKNVVLSAGEIVKLETLKIFLEKFNLKKKLLTLEVQY